MYDNGKLVHSDMWHGFLEQYVGALETLHAYKSIK